MQLPGRLDTTTLGDILGTLYRGHATGVLELAEIAPPLGGSTGRIHRIHLLSGLVAGVDTDLEVTPIGELLARNGKLDRRAIDIMLYRMALGDPRPAGAILIGMGAVSSDTLILGLRGQLQAKVNAVYLGIGDARVAFRTSRPLPKDALRIGTLMPRDFLQGRPRKRDRRRGGRSVYETHSQQPPPAAQRPWWASARPGYEGQTQDTPPPPSGSRRTSTSEPGHRDAGHASPPPPPSSPRALALRTLGLPNDADEVNIRRTFKRLAMELHPDRHATSPDEIRARNAARFAEASAAYHLLVA